MSSGPAPPVAEGEVLAAKYRVERVLGHGGMGVVVAAMHVQLRQRVAIKFLLPDATAEMTGRFLREARAAARLKSEHVARVIDVGELATGAPYMVMEYLEGSDLGRVIRTRGQLPIDDAVDYVMQACEAIAEAHVAGIVHRDLKPANLFLTTATDGSASVKVLDFGISKDRGEGTEDDMSLTKTTAVLGSPHYMAPEQMRSSRNVDARADIWSIGVILYQLLTKTVPTKAETFYELVLKVNSEDPPIPSSHRPDLPPLLDAVVMRCLRRRPEERYANVAALATALASFGRPESRAAAGRIARTQGATVPALDATTADPLPPPSIRTGSIGTPSAGGPPIPSALPSIPSPSGVGAATGGEAGASQPPGGLVPGGKTGAAWTSAEPSRTQVTGWRRTGAKALLAAGAVLVVGVVVGVAALNRTTPAKPDPGVVSSSPSPAITSANPTVVPPPPPPPELSVPVPATVTATATSKVNPPPPPPPATATATAAVTATHGPTGRPLPSTTPSTQPSAKKNPLDMEIQ